ncbi:DUF5408 family protein [Helicobacter sp. 23-1048]
MQLQDDNALNISKRGVKIAILCVFVVVVLGLINIYVLIVQIRSTEGIHNRVVVLEKELKDTQKMLNQAQSDSHQLNNSNESRE